MRVLDYEMSGLDWKFDVINLVDFFKMKKVFLFFITLTIIVLSVWGYYYLRWKHLWVMERPIPIYRVEKNNDDTIRVLVLGDSWAAMHSDTDSVLCSLIHAKISNPVVVSSMGKGGEISRGIYRLLFDNDSLETKRIIEKGVDYCVVFAGINDAAANLGTKQFCFHYRLILDFLIQNGIKPVVIEIPDVDIWNVYGNKPMKDLLVDFVRSTMTECRMYSFHEYRNALKAMLLEQHLNEQIVYVPMTCWNASGACVNQDLFLNDRVHLNRRGYERLDTCIAEAIICDLQQSQNSALVNQPVN